MGQLVFISKAVAQLKLNPETNSIKKLSSGIPKTGHGNNATQEYKQKVLT